MYATVPLACDFSDVKARDGSGRYAHIFEKCETIAASDKMIMQMPLELVQGLSEGDWVDIPQQTR